VSGQDDTKIKLIVMAAVQQFELFGKMEMVQKKVTI
jgi:hypothetical protein